MENANEHSEKKATVPCSLGHYLLLPLRGWQSRECFAIVQHGSGLDSEYI
jgi:hypothetical protein